MKRVSWTIVTIIGCLACGSTLGPEDAIIGSWRASQAGETVTWTFRNDGSLRIVTEQDEVGASAFTTRYSIDGSTIEIRAFNGNDDLGNPVDFAAQTCEIEISDRTLRLRCEGSVVTLTRVGPGSEANAV